MMWEHWILGDRVRETVHPYLEQSILLRSKDCSEPRANGQDRKAGSVDVNWAEGLEDLKNGETISRHPEVEQKAGRGSLTGETNVGSQEGKGGPR